MFNKIGPSLLILGLIVSCAKDKSYDEVSKTSDLKFASAHQEKSVFENLCTIDDPCLWMPAVAETPFEVTASRPYWQGAEKIVVSSLNNQGKLQFLHLEDDARFQNNINNLSPVLNIDVEHVDYECQEDAYGDCTNTEVVDTDKPWNKRRFVKIQDVSVVETNTLPIELGELFKQGCFAEVDKNITKLDVEKDSMFIKVKKTYKAQASCMSLTSLEQLRYLTFTVDYTYSIVKLSSLTDKNYNPVLYPNSDESRFGFFKSELKKKTVDNHGHFMGGRTTYANRWSPNKKNIQYFLSEDFYKPGMENIRKSTEDAIQTVNKSLNEAGTDLRITLERGTDSEIGDLRKNYIILVTDPQASGVIGYGPSVVNPNSGEILNARTVMYFGTIQKFVSRAYDELVEEVIKEAIMAETTETTETSNKSSATSHSQKNGFRSQSNTFSDFLAKGLDLSTFNVDDYLFGTHSTVIPFERTVEEQTAEIERAIEKTLKTNVSSFEEKVAEMAKETFYHGSQINYEQIVIDQLKKQIADGETPEMWDALTEAKRKKLMDLLLPYVWVPTLVHEFGHNLGLRHNFYGSTDTANFYSVEEAGKFGMRKAVTYSSIMDYAPKTNNELMVMGKYDVAALRFAYARKVEKADGTMLDIPVDQTLTSAAGETSLKRFKYCSDEHVDNDVMCNRHDEGTTNEEILDYKINSYVENYEKRNFRGRKYSFESYQGDVQYYLRLAGDFGDIYQFFRTFDLYSANGSFDGEEWKKNPQLVDIKKASDKAFDFFMNIIEQPAYHCVEYNPTAGTATKVAPFTEMSKGTQLEKYGITFDIRYGCLILNQFVAEEDRATVAYAEFGKYFNNSLDLIARNQPGFEIEPGDQSQIDVRGIWLDKVLATMFTGIRITTPSTIGAAAGGNFLDYPEYKNRILNSFNGVLTNNFVKPVSVTFPNGASQDVSLPYGFEGNHDVNKSFNGAINYVFGLSSSRTNMKSIMLKTLKTQLKSVENDGSLESGDAMDSYYYFDVDKISTRVDVTRFRYDQIVEFKNSVGKVKYRFGLYDYQEKAIELAKIKTEVESIQDKSQKVLNAALQVLGSEDITIDTLIASEDYSAEEIKEIKEVVKVDLDTIIGLMTGSLNHQVLLSSFLALSK